MSAQLHRGPARRLAKSEDSTKLKKPFCGRSEISLSAREQRGFARRLARSEGPAKPDARYLRASCLNFGVAKKPMTWSRSISVTTTS